MSNHHTASRKLLKTSLTRDKPKTQNPKPRDPPTRNRVLRGLGLGLGFPCPGLAFDVVITIIFDP